jgi:hypothetical protein
LPIDKKLELGVPPRRLDMAPYETGVLGAAFRRRYTEPVFINKEVGRVHVPLPGDAQLMITYAHDTSMTRARPGTRYVTVVAAAKAGESTWMVTSYSCFWITADGRTDGWTNS